ncbi:glycosyltransferase [Candidatus Omnitrophota bacterium]
MNNSSESPDLSIIIASRNSSRTIKSCLESLANQEGKNSLEIIVVDSSTDSTARLIAENFPQVKLYTFQERMFAGDARNFGILKAKAEIIAFLDADCVAALDWTEQILKAHQLPEPAIGGAVAVANPESYVGWASYFCEFSRWMPQTKAQRMDDICGASMTYKREVFKEYGFFLKGTYCSDTELHWRLKKGGKRLLFTPSVLVFHTNIENAGGFLKHEFLHGKYFALVRSRYQGFSLSRRLLYVILAPVIALKILLDRMLLNISNRVYFAHFLKSLPLLTLGLICWSLGEAAGYAVSKD